MANRLTGQVIKGIGGDYFVKLADGTVVICVGRGRLQRGDILYIGDMVEISIYNNGKGAIEKILLRKNKLIRPYISNIDTIIITIAIVPKPDFTLVDKLLIHCIKEDISAILCVNKSDIATPEFLSLIHNNYSGLAEIVEVSAIENVGFSRLLELIRGKFVCLSGQSAVGKSSIINALIGDIRMAVGEMSMKIERGKNTTRHIEIFEIGEGVKIADTCGFSVLELPKIDPKELSGYFVDFDEFAEDCRFRGCCHINEPHCAVRVAVDNGKLSRDRYNRYVALYEAVSIQWRNRYE